MVANCKALSRLISVYAIAHCIALRGRTKREQTYIPPYFLTPPHHVDTGCCCCCFLPCLSVSLSVHPLPSHLPFLPRRISAWFPHLCRGSTNKRSPEVTHKWSWEAILLLSGTLCAPVSSASHGRAKAVHCLRYLDRVSLGSVSVVSSCVSVLARSFRLISGRQSTIFSRRRHRRRRFATVDTNPRGIRGGT